VSTADAECICARSAAAARESNAGGCLRGSWLALALCRDPGLSSGKSCCAGGCRQAGADIQERHACPGMVRSRGLEPPRLAALTPQASASTNSATTASVASALSKPERRKQAGRWRATTSSGRQDCRRIFCGVVRRGGSHASPGRSRHADCPACRGARACPEPPDAKAPPSDDYVVVEATDLGRSAVNPDFRWPQGTIVESWRSPAGRSSQKAPSAGLM
jgi:hypothetical protein